MNNQDVMIERMFAQARAQSPEISFEETKKQFLGALVLASGGVLATKAILHLFTKKWIIMMTIVSVATSAVIVATTISYGETEGNLKPQQSSYIPAYIDVEDDENLAAVEIPELDNASKERIKDILVENGVVEESVDADNILDYANEDLFIIMPEDGLAENQVFVPEDTTHKDKHKENRIQITPYSHRFEINQYTTQKELDQIKAQAELAGIKFTYKAHFHESKLEDISINMKLNYQDDKQSTNISSTMVEDDINDDTKIVFGWTENEKGKAYSIGTGEDTALMMEMDNQLFDMDEHMMALDESMKALDVQMAKMDGMVFAFDCDSAAFAFAPDCEAWANHLIVPLPEFDFDFDFEVEFEIEALQESIEEIESLESIDEERLEELNLQLEALQLKLAELRERMREQQEEMHEHEEHEHEERNHEHKE